MRKAPPKTLGDSVQVHQDKATGMVWGEGPGPVFYSCHPYITDPAADAKDFGWSPTDRIVEIRGRRFNLEVFEAGHPYDKELAGHCACQGCDYRKDQAMRRGIVRNLLRTIGSLHSHRTGGWQPKTCLICEGVKKAADAHDLRMPSQEEINAV